MASPEKATIRSNGEPKQAVPAISLPKGGGAVRGMGEKFAANPVTGTGSMSVPIATSPGRSGFGPQLSLSYDSGSGNGPFGFGWNLSIPAIMRKTDKGLPQYHDAEESDVYILSGSEDLVPVLQPDGTRFKDDTTVSGYSIHRYRPRIEGLFARIERWTNASTGEIHWRSITRDNVTTLYGSDNNSRIFDPAEPDLAHPTRIFSWLICQSYDDKGNSIVYEYAEENDDSVDLTQANERNRVRTANRYLKRIKYGNRLPNRDATTWQATNPRQLPNDTWMFELVFDYGEGHYSQDSPDDQGRIFVQAQIDPADGSHWPAREDPFSSYRAGFEVRTYRLCRRVLMFHHFPQELDVADCLVRATEFSYLESPIASFITGISLSGYVRQPTLSQSNRYVKGSFPPLEFEYSQIPNPQELALQPTREIDPASLENLPIGLDGASYQWLDLDGEGISGILSEQADGWYYKRNLSANNIVTENGNQHVVARLGATEVVARKPAVGLADGGQFLDLAGDGQLDLVQMEGSERGFYERTEDADWAPFRPFVSTPDLNTRDANLRFVDLTGDSHADILITEGEVLTWYPSLAQAGFGPAVRVSLPLDEEKGPRLVFADGEQSIYLADFSGDGLSDLVRIRNGEVSYWPNLGYGRFGAKVTMDNAPWFDNSDQFDERRIRLADTDGSGTTDVLYLRRDSVQIYFNQSGNRWSDAVPLPQFPVPDNVSSVRAVDLLGNGTACLVWSSPLPGAVRLPMRYVALMDEKPHLLVGVKNNVGAETKVHYAPSTKFYLDDKLAGKSWITRLPFPVHVVERVETYDHISRNYFVTRYAYHHGYFDHVEREFRGFGMVEQKDTEEFAVLTENATLPDTTNLDAASHVPPVMTKTWFHMGACIGRDHVSDFFAGFVNADDEGEYYGEPGLTDEQARALLLPDSVLPAELPPEELPEACRALKGSVLRQEIYALDGTDKAAHPYTITEQNFTVERLQPRDGNRHAVFFAHAREALTYHYERNPADPRIQHALTLEVDDFGNVLKSAAVGYGRRESIRVIAGLGEVTEVPNPDLNKLDPRDQEKQTQLLLMYTETRITNSIDTPDDYRTPLPAETRTYELTGYGPTGPARRFQPSDFVKPDPNDPEHLIQVFDSEIQYEQQATSGRQRRLIEQVRTLYRKDDLSRLLPLGRLESLALQGESYKLAFTPGLLVQVFQRNSQALLPNPGEVLGGQGPDRGGYVDLDNDGYWWIPSGRVFMSPNGGDAATQELSFARHHFFLPHRYRDPFHTPVVSTESIVTHDGHNLLMVQTRDPAGNIVAVETYDDNGNTAIRNDYRVLQPYWITDPNGNRTQVEFDVLSLVVATAVMGKPGENKGDKLDNVKADLTQTDLNNFHNAPDPHALAADLLQGASTRILYDLDRFRLSQQADPDDPSQWEAPYAATLARETHLSDLLPPHGLKIQVSFSYSDGFGREIQKKIQAEPGPVPTRDANGRIIVGSDGLPVVTANDVSPRWVGSGWTVFNNKGKPVRQYEPFFTDMHRFEFGVRIGVSPVLFYDPVERVVATLHPNHTYEKVVFDSWQQENWDVNDTVLRNPKTDDDVDAFFLRLPDEEYGPAWYEQRASGGLGVQEQNAASKAAVHAETPSRAHTDSLGRTFLTIAHNKFKFSTSPPTDPPVEEFYPTRILFDIEGNQRAVIDAKDRIVIRYDYDMLSNRVHQASMEASERWILNDVAGKPLYSWDSRDHQFRTAYDPLRRPTESYLREGTGPELTVGRTIYGENQPNPEVKNQRGKVVQVFDQAGLITSDDYDFKGNLKSSRRQLASEYKATLDWAAGPQVEMETFIASTSYDALNRPITVVTPDQSVYRPTFNEANLLETVDVNLRGAAMATPFVTNIDYNAKGQRTLIEYGNNVKTEYNYEPLTFRLSDLKTTRSVDEALMQGLSYTYDPAGNIIHIQDRVQQTIYFNNQVVTPHNDYMYDAIYRLINAEGREHPGQHSEPQTSWDDRFRVHLPHPGDGQVMRRYTEEYDYDQVGNFLRLFHQTADGNWTRSYAYNEPSLLEPARKSNRLSSTTVGGNNPVTETYSYDAHGNMTSMPHLSVMQWDFRDQLQSTSQQVAIAGTPEATYYVYDGAGQRIRKVTEHQNGTRKEERYYFGGFEVYRKYENDGSAVNLEREALHVMDDKQRIALVETRTQGNEPGVPQQLIRYQFSNHLGSATLELDDQAQIISYEEYYPYGSTSYQAVRSQTETPKRYRYTGMERDEESGLNYHHTRYYSAWLCRWVSADKIGVGDGPNLYQIAESNPIRYIDLRGTNNEETKASDIRMPHSSMAKYIGNKQGGLTELANKIKGLGERSGVTIEVALANIKGGKQILIAGINTGKEGGFNRRQLKQMKKWGINVAPQYAEEYGKGGPHAEENIAAFVKKLRGRVERWSVGVVGKSGSYNCEGCQRIMRDVGGEVEQPYAKLQPIHKQAIPERAPNKDSSYRPRGIGGGNKAGALSRAAATTRATVNRAMALSVGLGVVRDLHEGDTGTAVAKVGIAGALIAASKKIPGLGSLATVAVWGHSVISNREEIVESAVDFAERHVSEDHPVLGGIAAAGYATKEAVYDRFLEPIGTDIGEGAAAAVIEIKERATSDRYTIIPWKTELWDEFWNGPSLWDLARASAR